MTTNDIDAIRKLTDTATRGPWTNGRDGLAEYEVHLSAFLPLLELSAGLQGEANARFIAAARTLVPALCDEIEQLRAALTNARAVASDRIADRDKICRDVMAERDAARAMADELRAELDGLKPVAFPSGEQLYAHRCNNVEWWHEPGQGPINDQGCDACESAPFLGGWRPVYVREVSR